MFPSLRGRNEAGSNGKALIAEGNNLISPFFSVPFRASVANPCSPTLKKKPPIPFETGGPPSQRPNFLYPSNGARLKSTVAVPFATTVTCFSKASISSCQPMMVWLPTGTFGSE
jgi:hypothetical protein